MKRIAAGLLLCIASAVGAQDASYSELRLRLSVFRNPIAGPITDDWRPGTGFQAEIATPLAVGEFGIAVGHVRYRPVSGKPKYAATLFTLAWLSGPLRYARLELSGGFRLTDYRMDFDDPSMVVGLRTEEEVLLGAIARARMPFANGFSFFADGSYGVLMLGTRTPMALVHVGVERAVRTPGWIREILR